MKLTLKIKLLPSKEQADLLLQTIKEANAVCNTISEIAWEKKVFNQFKIHNEVYHTLKGSSNLSAQVLVRCISKVADAYKLDRKVKRTFKPLGSITYDSRYLPPEEYFTFARDYFKSYITDSEFRDIIENRKYALLNTNPNGDVFRKLPPELRFAIPEYIKDNVSLNKFVA